MKDATCSKFRHTATATATQRAPTRTKNQQRRTGPEGSFSRSLGAGSGVAAKFVPGSLKWLVSRLSPGDSLIRPDASETTRRACLRAIDAVTLCDPSRKHDLSLWFVVHHTGRGESFRMLRLKRRA